MTGQPRRKPLSPAQWGFLGAVLVAVVGTIGTIVVALVNRPSPTPQPTPTVGQNQPAASSGAIAGSQVIPATTLGDFLVTIRRVPRNEAVFQQLGDVGDIPGASVLANIRVDNLQAKPCRVTGFVQKSPGGEIVPQADLPQGFDPQGITDYTFSPDGPIDAEQADFWLAYPVVPGTYMITTELYCSKRLASEATAPFRVEPGTGDTPTTQPDMRTATAVDTITPILGGTTTISVESTVSPQISPSVALTPAGTPIKFVPVIINPAAPRFKLPPEFYHPIGSSK